ncbi:MAG TPA: hypothetical protein VG963_03050 [Polyangiaceae bacterium]|nr:hypothetical protein [Polyangiaceae bacterium]
MALRTWVAAIALAMAVLGAAPAGARADDPVPAGDLVDLTPEDLLPVIIEGYSTADTVEDFQLLLALRYLYLMLGGDPTLLPPDVAPSDGTP